MLVCLKLSLLHNSTLLLMEPTRDQLVSVWELPNMDKLFSKALLKFQVEKLLPNGVSLQAPSYHKEPALSLVVLKPQESQAQPSGIMLLQTIQPGLSLLLVSVFPRLLD
jgi:hypothetical protein